MPTIEELRGRELERRRQVYWFARGQRIRSRKVQKGYFVDATSGDDNNNGLSPAGAWKTISKVNGATFIADDRIHFKSGEVWRETLTPGQDGVSGSPIIFTSYGNGAAPIISAADLITGWTVFSGNVWQATVTTEPKIVLFNGTVGTLESGTGTIDAENEWFWSANTLYVYSTSDPDTAFASPGIEAGARTRMANIFSRQFVRLENLHLYGGNDTVDGGLTWNGSSSGANLEIINCTIEKCAGFGIRAYNSSNNTVSRCTFNNNGSTAVQFIITAVGGTSAGNLILSNTVTNHPRMGIDLWGRNNTDRLANCTVDGNTVSTVGDGIYLHRANSCTISNNTVTDVDSTATFAEGLGVGVQAGSSNTIENNSISRCWNRGIELWGDSTETDGPSTGNVIRYNVIFDNGDQSKLSGEAGGIFMSADDVTNTQIYYNLIYGHNESSSFGEYGVFGTGTGHTVYNNVFYDNYITISPWEADADNWKIKNNIIASSVVRHIDVIAGATGDYDYNLYSPDGATIFRWAGVNSNFADWKTSSSHDANSPTPADPLFIDEANNDYRIQSGSPARNSGTDVSLTRDYAGESVPKEANPAIGAYEHV